MRRGQGIVKKGQVYEGLIEEVRFPDKGIVFLPDEEKPIVVRHVCRGRGCVFLLIRFAGRGLKEGFWR